MSDLIRMPRHEKRAPTEADALALGGLHPQAAGVGGLADIPWIRIHNPPPGRGTRGSSRRYDDFACFVIAHLREGRHEFIHATGYWPQTLEPVVQT